MSDLIMPPGYLELLRGVLLRAGWCVTTSSTGPSSFIAMSRLPSRRREPAPATRNRAARRAARGDL